MGFVQRCLRWLLLLCVLVCAGAPAWAGEGADDFIRAIKQDNRSRMEALLRQGVDPNTRDSRGVPGLYVALQEGALEVAKVILASPRLNPELRTPTDESALMVAALRGQLDIVEALIVKGAQVNKTGWTPLHYAATGGNVEVIGLLLKHGARLEARSPNGSTPLMMAARYGSLEAVQALLRAGADPRLRNETGMDALDYAVSGQRVDAVELLTQFRQRASARRSPPAPTVAEQVTGSSQPPLAPNPIAQPLPPPGQAVQVMHEPPRQAARSMPELPAGQALQVMPAAAASEAASVPARFRLTLPAPGQAEQVLPASRPAEPTAATVSGPAHRITPPAPPAEARW